MRHDLLGTKILVIEGRMRIADEGHIESEGRGFSACRIYAVICLKTRNNKPLHMSCPELFVEVRLQDGLQDRTKRRPKGVADKRKTGFFPIMKNFFSLFLTWGDGI